MAKAKSPIEQYRAAGNLESAFQARVVDLAHFLGYKAAHFRQAQNRDGSWVTPVAGDGEGFPDLVLVKRVFKRVIWMELKQAGRWPEPAQAEWLDDLAACHREVYLCYPVDMDEIQQLLTMGHEPNLIELADIHCAWANRRKMSTLAQKTISRRR